MPPAAVATAWSAFQAATWNGRQTFALARAAKDREHSTQARAQGDQQSTLDVALFVAWAKAYQHHDDVFATFLYDRFPPRLKKATDAWLATAPFGSSDGPAHPFALPEYQTEAHARADALATQADDEVAAGVAANRQSDTYVLATVIFATVILLATIGLRLQRRSTRRTLLILTALTLFVSTAWVAARPVAWVG